MQPPPAPASNSNRIPIALGLGFASLVGLVFPPLVVAGVAGIFLSWTGRRYADNSALRGKAAAWIALGLSVLGSLLSLVIPAFIASVWIYALFHNGQLPYGGNGPTPAGQPFPSFKPTPPPS